MGTGGRSAGSGEEAGAEHWANWDGLWVHWGGLQLELPPGRGMEDAERRHQRHRRCCEDHGGRMCRQAIPPSSIPALACSIQCRKRSGPEYVKRQSHKRHRKANYLHHSSQRSPLRPGHRIPPPVRPQLDIWRRRRRQVARELPLRTLQPLAHHLAMGRGSPLHPLSRRDAQGLP